MGIRIVLFLFLLSSGITLCHKEPDYFKSEGTITGPDLRDCMCCGGWYITIDTTQYEFDILPDNSVIDLGKETFPLKVKLDWRFTNSYPCPFKWIVIERIKKD